MESFDQLIASPWTQEILCSALAGVTARFPCHPLDTLKAISMSHVHAHREEWAHMKDFVAREGIRGMYRGADVACLGAAPGVALFLTSYELTKQCLEVKLTVSGSSIQFHAAIDLISGFVAEAVSCVVWVPIDVLKERLQVQTTEVVNRYQNGSDALRTCLRLEGLRGLYMGYWGTLLVYGPTSALYFCIFERLKHTEKGPSETNRMADIPFTGILWRAFIANAVATGVTTPLEVAKLRLQIQRAKLYNTKNKTVHIDTRYTYHYKGIIDALQTIAKQEGLRGMYKGMLQRIAFTAPNAALTMALYSFFKTQTFHHTS